jgi:hypothetical protein
MILSRSHPAASIKLTMASSPAFNFFKTIDFSRNGEMVNVGCAGSRKGLGMLFDLVAAEAMGATN